MSHLFIVDGRYSGALRPFTNHATTCWPVARRVYRQELAEAQECHDAGELDEPVVVTVSCGGEVLLLGAVAARVTEKPAPVWDGWHARR